MVYYYGWFNRLKLAISLIVHYYKKLSKMLKRKKLQKSV